ncbi:MAG: M3 family oligoendopeptidase [Gemmatimonadaceae bacterium]
MPIIELPESPAALVDATWRDIAPYYEALASAPLGLERAEEWMMTWSRLEEIVAEAGTLAMVAYTGDTADPAKEAAYLRFSAEIYPLVDEQQVRLAKRLLALGYSRPDLEVLLRQFRTDAEIFRERNVPLFSELEELSARYQKIVGGLSVEFDGARRTVPQLQPFLQSHAREVREAAFLAGADCYVARRDEFADVFDRMYVLRQELARNAGFANFEEYIFRAKYRFDYTAGDCARFHDAVAAVVVPAARRVLADRRERLGVDTLRPWDLAVDPDHAPPLRPFATVDEFVAGARRVFGAIDHRLGAYFDTMADEGLLDLESRPGKAPGGYCTKLHFRRKPFVFMNAVGVPDDVNTLIHEAGHCFHAFAASGQPFIWQRGTGSEAAELASMSMELLAAPHLALPKGYYAPVEAIRARLDHLEDVVLTLPHIASVDAFQSWIYTSGEGHDRTARDSAWLRIRDRYEKGIDWEGLRPQRLARWYRQLHIFEHPFYYIEYGIAQLGALQVWRESLRDPREAVERYKRALALGGTRSLPDIYGAAGAKLVFDAPGMSALIGLVEETMKELRGQLEEQGTGVRV